LKTQGKILIFPSDSLGTGTVLNFDAILARLDFVFSDRRPLHIIEQELSILTQGKLSVMEYYNQVYKKLTLLTNKTIMTYGRNKPITSEINNRHRQSALRVFVTGLNGPISSTLYSMNPTDLPNAMAFVQEMESNNMSAKFAHNFVGMSYRNYNSNYGNGPEQNK